MVAIKIQSKEDIIAAYLASLGFSGKNLSPVVSAVSGRLNFHSDNGDELVGKIDDVLLKLAEKTFPDTKLDREQLLAEFKLCFLLCNGASQCSAQEIKDLDMPAELTKAMRRCFVVSAPACSYHEMKPQKIESFHQRKKKK